jgi:adenine-specific DNA-methyltransferase
MNDHAVRQAIKSALLKSTSQPLAEAATHLLGVLGYNSEKRFILKHNTPDAFLATFAHGRKLNDRSALTGEWQCVDFLFQVTDSEIKAAGNLQFGFESKGA